MSEDVYVNVRWIVIPRITAYKNLVSLETKLLLQQNILLGIYGLKIFNHKYKMLRKYLSRAVKYGLVGGIAIAATVIATSYDYGPSTLVRITRTVVTAVDIGRTYQTMLYSKPWDVNSVEYLEIKSKAHQRSAEKLLDLCIANKGAYIKVGQHVGALDYLLPSEYVTTMRILHKDAPKNTVEELYKVIREDLKEDPKKLFVEFDPEPLGTASLAQVHRARLKDGQEVAVKVQHHFVRKNIQIDISWMEMTIKAMSRVFPDFQMDWLVEETKKNIFRELDFIQEGKNAERVAEMFKHYTWLKVPKIFWEYSTERVLVMEYVQGGQVNDVKYIDEHNINKGDLCRKLGDLYSHMIFISGFVHGDPHPGNILLKKDPGDKDVSVFLLDHGLYGELSGKFRYHYSKLWLSIIYRDRRAMREHSEALGIRKELFGLFISLVTGRPWSSVKKGIDGIKPTSEEKRKFQDDLPSIAPYITQCLQSVDRQALLVLKTNDLIRSAEFALGMQDRMCAFLVMTKYCMESVYIQEYKKAESFYQKQYLNMKFAWSMLTLYLYAIFLNFVEILTTECSDCSTR